MTWKPPPDWQETLIDAMAETLFERGLEGSDVTRRGGPGHRYMWNWGRINRRTGKYSLPTLRSLVGWCGAVGIRPSELLARCGL